MPDKVVRYTRQVTVAWCVFFATQLVVSAALLLAAPAGTWSAFVSLLSRPFGTSFEIQSRKKRKKWATTYLESQ